MSAVALVKEEEEPRQVLSEAWYALMKGKLRALPELLSDPELSKPADWVVDQFFERGSLNSVYGIGKGGKSTLLAHLAIHVSLGIPFAGYAVPCGRVLWIDLEQGARRSSRNLKKLPHARDAVDMQVYTDLEGSFSVGMLSFLIGEYLPSLVVIDSLSKFFPEVLDDNDNAAWAKALKPLEAVARASNAAVVVIDHDRKGEGENGRGMRGASSKLAAFDTAVHVTRGSGANVRKLSVVSREVGDFTVSLELAEGAYRRVGALADPILESLIGAGIPMSVSLMHSRMVGAGFAMDRKTVGNRLEKLLALGKVSKSVAAGTVNDPALYTAISAEK